MNNLTGSLEEFSLNFCEDLSMPVQHAACVGYRTGFCCASKIMLKAFTECTSSGEFDVAKFSRMLKPYLDDMTLHAKL